MMKIGKVLKFSIIIIFICQSVAFCSTDENSTLRPPSQLSKGTKEFIRDNVARLALESDLATDEIKRAIEGLETTIQNSSEAELERNTANQSGIMKFSQDRRYVEINIGSKITAYASIVKGEEGKSYKIRGLVNPYNKSQFILILLKDNYVGIRLYTGEWLAFRLEGDYVNIGAKELRIPALNNFIDNLWEGYFNDGRRRLDYLVSKDTHRKRKLRITSIGENVEVTCGPISWRVPKERGGRWGEILPRLRRVGYASYAVSSWPFGLIEVIPEETVEGNPAFFKTKEGGLNYLLFLPLSDRILIYKEEGLVKTIRHSNTKESRRITKEFLINTFIDSIYWHGGFEWVRDARGEQMVDGEEHQIPYARFTIGTVGDEGGAVFQTYGRQNIFFDSPKSYLTGPSWYPARRIVDEDGNILAEVLWLGKEEFALRIKERGTDGGRQVLVLLKGRYFYLPILGSLLQNAKLVTPTFTSKIGEIVPLPGEKGADQRSKARYTIENIGPTRMYDYELGMWGDRPTVRIILTGGLVPARALKRFSRTMRTAN